MYQVLYWACLYLRSLTRPWSSRLWVLTLDFSKRFSSTVFNTLLSLSEMWYWIFLWALFSSLFVHGAAGVLMFVMLQRHRQGRVISVIAVSIGFLASVTGAMITSAAVAGIYRVAGKNMAPLEALVWGVGQTVLTLIISFSRILATLWGFCGNVFTSHKETDVQILWKRHR